MLHFAFTRLVSLSLSLIAASVVIFSVIEIIPGDPASFMLGINAQPDTIAALRDQLGLNGSIISRYFNWISGMLTGDFGISYTYRVPVSELIMARVWISLPLAIYALAISTLIAFPVGLIAAANRGKPFDLTIMGTTQLGVAIPNFWFAMILVLIFAINLRWFSAGGFPGWDQGFLLSIKSLTLPAIALALPQASILARIMRSSILGTLDQDYVRTAKSKGLTNYVVIMRHAMRNAWLPVVTIIGLEFGFMISGVVVVEVIFAWPGLGRTIFDAIANRDIPLVQAAVVVISVFVIIINLITDLVYAKLDPRIKL